MGYNCVLVMNRAPEGEGSATPPEPQPTPFTSQTNVSELLIEPLQTETPLPVFQTEAHIEQLLPSSTTYQRKRKTQKHRRTKKDTKLPQTSQSHAPRHHGGAHAQTRSERVLAQPIEPSLSEGHTSGSGEGRMEHQFELMANVLITPHDSPLPGGHTPGSDEVYTLFMDGTPMEINMLVEKKYPLIKKLLEKMLTLQLEAEEESTMAFELIKFIKSMLEE
ncbi:hypothetical protein Tco_1216169 [Tanacetum coccineum]